MTYANVDIEGAGTLVIEAVPLRILQLGEGPAPEDALHGMRMTTQSEVHIAFKKDFTPPMGRIVTHQELEPLSCSL